MDSGARYKIIVSPSADLRYVDTILPYLHRNFSYGRLVEIDAAIGDAVHSLATRPNRGSKELSLDNREREFRYILFRETRHFELKILYYVDEDTATVLVVDYFPTAMHPKGMRGPKSER